MSDDNDPQAPPAMMDRIAAQFGLAAVKEAPEPAAQETTEEPSGDELADLTWGEKTYRVPSTLKDAFMRNEDYTRKTQDLAKQRESIDHVRSLAESRQIENAFGQSIAAEQQELSVIDAYLAQASKMDWAQMSTDQMLRARVEIDKVKDRKVELREAIEGKRSKFQGDIKAKMDELRGKSRELASKSIPAFSEETEKAMRVFAQGEGLTGQELDNVLLDPRSYKIIWKAMQFDKVKAGTAQVAQTASVLKPGAAGEKMPPEVRAKLEYNRAMKSAKTSAGKAALIEEKLVRGSIFNRG